MEVELQPQHQVEVYLEVKHQALDYSAQRHKASPIRQPNQQDPSSEEEVRQLLVAHCLEEEQAPSQRQPLGRYSEARHQHQLLVCQGARHTHRVNLREVNRSLEELHNLQVRQEAQLLVELLLRQQNQPSVEDHRQVVASLVALEPGQAACLVVRKLVAVSAVRLLRQRQACRPVALQLKVDLVVVASSEVEVEPHQAASSAAHQPLHHLEELQQLQEAVSLAAVPPKHKETLYLEDSHPKPRHSEEAKQPEKASSTQQVFSVPPQRQQRKVMKRRSSAGERNGKIK